MLSYDHLQAQIAELTRINAELTEANRRKDDFLATLGHDLRNPLVAVAGSAELLRMPDLEPADQARIRDVLQRQLLQLSRLVEELLSTAQSLRSAPSAPASNNGADAELPRRRILLVDDSVDATETMARLLTFIGQDVQIAHDGLTALRIAETFRPELILLDIGLPGLSGFEVARRLRQLSGMNHVQLVAVTGMGRDEDRARCLEAGFDQHLLKPVALKTIETLLGGGGTT